ETFSDWRHAYFTPDQIAQAAVSGPDADPDADEIPNLLEYAFNLDPTYAERSQMPPDTGLRGLPSIRIERVASSDFRLTVEFVRRTAGSGADVTYQTKLASSFTEANWQDAGT